MQCENKCFNRKIDIIFKINLFMGVSAVPVREIALALLMQMSIPPNLSTVSCTAFFTACSSLKSGI